MNPLFGFLQQIDEDMADEGDEDDMDLDAVDAGGVTTNTAAGEARTGAGAEEFAAVGDKKDRKSVRMSMDMAGALLVDHLQPNTRPCQRTGSFSLASPVVPANRCRVEPAW